MDKNTNPGVTEHPKKRLLGWNILLFRTSNIPPEIRLRYFFPPERNNQSSNQFLNWLQQHATGMLRRLSKNRKSC